MWESSDLDNYNREGTKTKRIIAELRAGDL